MPEIWALVVCVKGVRVRDDHMTVNQSVILKLKGRLDIKITDVPLFITIN